MNDYQLYGPPAWASRYGAEALTACERLVALGNSGPPTTPEFAEGLKSIAKEIKGEFSDRGPFPLIILASRISLGFGAVPAPAINDYTAAEKALRERALPVSSITQGQQTAIDILHHLYLMEAAKNGDFTPRASYVNPLKYDQHVLADTFAAVTLRSMATEEGVKREDMQQEYHRIFRRNNRVSISYTCDDFSIDRTTVTIKNGLPETIIASLKGHRISEIIEHRLTNDNPAIVTGVTQTKDDLILETDAGHAHRLEAFKIAA